jgi:nucleoside-triphosphatase
VSAAGRVLLLTGRPGVGKTTVIRAAASRLTGWRIGGFYTEEIRAGGARQGFRLVTFDGRARVMAHVAFHGPLRVGQYGVDVGVIDDVAATALAAAADVHLVDEIGRMECLAPRFVSAMRALLGAGTPVVATVALRGEGFIGEVKRQRGVTLWEVTRANRDAMPAEVAGWLEGGRHDDVAIRGVGGEGVGGHGRPGGRPVAAGGERGAGGLRARQRLEPQEPA